MGIKNVASRRRDTSAGKRSVRASKKKQRFEHTSQLPDSLQHNNSVDPYRASSGHQIDYLQRSEHNTRCGCANCTNKVATRQPSGKNTDNQKVIQRQCDSCGNVFCYNGSMCGHRNRKYSPGEHGFKKNEQALLAKQFGMKVTGSDFESEHSVGFEPINQTTGLKRGTSGRAHDLEFGAPAYQEYKPFHRDHIGTGSSLQYDNSGFNSQSYRDSQRHLIESGDISSAVQINQLGYSFNPGFQNPSNAQAMDVADSSFNTMVGGMNNFTYGTGDQDTSIQVTSQQRAEMYLSRLAARQGHWPTDAQVNEAKRIFGLT